MEPGYISVIKLFKLYTGTLVTAFFKKKVFLSLLSDKNKQIFKGSHAKTRSRLFLFIKQSIEEQPT